MKTLIIIVMSVSISLSSVCASAQTDKNGTSSTKKTETTTGQDAKNAILGWTEIPKSIVEVTNESKNPLAGLTRGALKGIIKAFSKTVSGMANAVSPSDKITAKSPDTTPVQNK